MRYEGVVYRPPSEANSVLIQATIGCPHNRCAFCAMYKDKPFRIRPLQEIREDIDSARAYYGDDVDTMFFPDGNTIIMKTEQLEEIFQYARKVFPALERITLYGSSRFINLKKPEELARLKAAGLSRIHSGMESGDDVTLALIDKGADAASQIEAGRKVKAAGLELSEYIMLGVGGKERTKEHAAESARVLNAIGPDFIRLRTFIPMAGTPLYTRWRQGEFTLLRPHEALAETALLIKGLETPGMQLYSDHYSNYAYVNGSIPEDKEAMLAVIDKLLAVPESSFRPPETGSL